MWRAILKASVLFVSFLASMLLLWSYGNGPRPQHTGGFEEKTCVSCHSDFALNAGRLVGGTFDVDGVPSRYEPGRRYPLTVRIGHPGQSRWGFQLTARFADSARQAGQLEPVDERTQIREADGVQYVEHTEEGSRPGTPDGPVEFRFVWLAPNDPSGTVIFNAAGNAANNDREDFGDYIYTAGAFSRPSTAVATEEPPQVLTDSSRPLRRRNTSSRFVHIPAPVNLERGSMEIHIEHRFLQSLGDATPGTAFGIDSGANIMLGFNYALSDRFSAGISRARFDRIVSLLGTYEVLTGGEEPWNLSLVGGIEGRNNFERHFSPFVQLASSVDYRHLRLVATPTVVFNSRMDSEVGQIPNPINPGSNATFSLGLGADLALTPAFSFIGEATPRLAGFGGFGSRNPAYAAGIKISSWGHVFTVVASTSQTFTPGRFAIDAEKDFSLGFNIYRRIR